MSKNEEEGPVFEKNAKAANMWSIYNTRRRHSALDRRTPDAVYYEQVTPELAA